MNPRLQIYGTAFGVSGTSFALGIQLCLSFLSGYGWWKVGMAAFSVLCLTFVLWRTVRQVLPKVTN
jgi:hypothetical protein